MAAAPPNPGVRAAFGRVPPVVWLVLAVLAGLSVWAINGGALFYYDSPAYLDQGNKILSQLGLGAMPDGAGGGGVAVASDNQVNGSRAAVFGIAAALLHRLGGVGAIVLANLALCLFVGWILAGILRQIPGVTQSRMLLVGVPLLAAMAGSLPFYLAFIMPDILTPLLLLSVAMLAVFSRQMRPWEIVLITAIGAFAVTAHISHIPVAAALVPFAAIMSAGIERRRWWLAPLLVSLMVVAGVAERQAFRLAAEKVTQSEVVYYPFLTARLIEDGPGWEYLKAKCPDPKIGTCKLFGALSKSDDPYRLTASHIIFKKTPDLGSFQLLNSEDQATVAREQFRFYAHVFLWAPLSTTASVIKNTFQQAALNDIKMTVPTAEIIGNTRKYYPDLAASLHAGRLSASRGWLAYVAPVHISVYLLSLGIVGWLTIIPGQVPARVRAFAVMVLLGILANAFVTGALSQPADRYGARVIWLLPFMAALMMLVRRRAGPQEGAQP